MIRGVLVLAAVFVVVTLLAELLGAANTGTAMSFGQMAFALAAVALVVYAEREPDDR
ncbi:hypothetical protein [Conexibacter sp. SYSU D00693]|uniref:hypothetical protein n=1 Tax=Conexibacter sp. SYSU D00693 TaxID=2812560 RepID=UPI00196A992C|nr:hypothetical protein [Conexibacter sp. SYSU D00693]